MNERKTEIIKSFYNSDLNVVVKNVCLNKEVNILNLYYSGFNFGLIGRLYTNYNICLLSGENMTVMVMVVFGLG